MRWQHMQNSKMCCSNFISSDAVHLTNETRSMRPSSWPSIWNQVAFFVDSPIKSWAQSRMWHKTWYFQSRIRFGFRHGQTIWGLLTADSRDPSEPNRGLGEVRIGLGIRYGSASSLQRWVWKPSRLQMRAFFSSVSSGEIKLWEGDFLSVFPAYCIRRFWSKDSDKRRLPSLRSLRLFCDVNRWS
jgi:hypothetical protein